MQSKQKRIDKFSGVTASAVALKRGTIGYHAGVLYRKPRSTSTKIVHLEWHHKLKNNDPTDEWGWVPTEIDEDVLMLAAALCDLIAKHPKKGTIPYGFEFGDSAIASDGEVLIGGTSVGLTCSTFVLAVFRKAGQPLLDPSTWKKRPEDANAHRSLLGILKSSKGVDPTHFAAVELQVECMRYRPEEVAGSSAKGPWPKTFATAKEDGRKIKEHAFGLPDL